MRLSIHECFQILDLPPAAYNEEQIKEAYRRRAKILHPDAGGSQEQFERLNAAYQQCKGGIETRRRVVPNVGVPRASGSSIFDAAELGEAFMRHMRSNWNEATFQSRVKDCLETAGAYVFNVHGSAMQSQGWPDLYVASPHYHGWLELKVDSRQCEPLQAKRIQELRKRGVPAYVLRCVNLHRRMQLETHERDVVDTLSLDEWGAVPVERGQTLLRWLKSAI